MIKDKKRRRLVILTVVILVMIFSIGGIILFQVQDRDDSQNEEIQKTTIQHRPETVNVQTTIEQATLEIKGRVQAENRLELFPEVQGQVKGTQKPFREGVTFEEGEVIFQLDDTEARLQLYSTRSGFQTLVASLLPDIRLDYPEHLQLFEEWYKSLHPERSLTKIPDFDHHTMKQFLTSRGIFDRYYQIKSTENRLEKFHIKAPFSGVLSAAKVEPGQSVGPQSHVGTFVDTGRFLITASVRQSHLDYIGMGDTAILSDQQRIETWTATVIRINPTVDPRTQTVEIYLEVKGNGIREGMYLEGSLESGEPIEIAEIPKTALLRNGYVYALSDGVIRQVPIRVVDVGHQTVKVTGLEDTVTIIRNAGRALTGSILEEVSQ